MTVSAVLDAAGRRRSPATMPGYHARRPPRNKGRLYPADPPTVEEIVAVMRETSDDPHGYRLRALIVVLWRGGLRVAEALALGERDLDPRRGSLLVRNGKGGRRREIGMDAWGWEQLRPWLAARLELPVGPLFCVIDGPTRGRPWASANVRVEFRRLAAQAGIRRRFAPHQLRHAHAVELAHEGVPLNVIQRQLGHANLGTTSIYLQGIDTDEIIATVHARRAPMMSATAGLQLRATPTASAGAPQPLPLPARAGHRLENQCDRHNTSPAHPLAPATRRGCRTNPRSVRAGDDDSAMALNFIECDREQAFLMPPSLREWLPEDHLAWFVLDAVAEMDLSEVYADYRADGQGRAAYEPSMVVALLLYAYATRQRSSRAIERHCRQDVAYRVITANRVPDHATIARFLARHEAALAGLFGSVLALCARAGLVSTGVVAIDGTKLAANASRGANLDYERIAREIVAEAQATDEAEDELYGGARGDELPEELHTSEGRRRWLREAKRALDAERTMDPPQAAFERTEEPLSMPRGRALNQGRRGWLRDARQRLDERRAQEARAVPRSRGARLSESKRRLEEDLVAERRANAAYEAYRARGISRDGRRFGGDPPSPYRGPDTPAGKINTTDPDSRLLKAAGIGYVQGYNAQAAVSEEQIVLAAEIVVDSPDFGHLEPMLNATVTELGRAGVTDSPEVVVADAGYWHHEQIDSLAAGGIQVLIPPDAGKRNGARPGWQGGRYEWMRRVLATDLGERLYRKRSQTVEPMFGHTKHNRGMSRFHRRGRSAARTEWRLITATHNLTKLHSHTLAAATA